MLVADVTETMEAIPACANRVKPGLDLAELLRQNALPAYSPAFFVIHGGIVPKGPGRAATGYFLQMVDEVVSIVIVQRTAGDVTGGKGQAALHELVFTLIFALCGRAPDGVDPPAPATDPIGVLEVRGGRVLRLQAGAVFYQLDLAIQNQVRILL